LLENATVVRRYDKRRFPPAGLAGGKAGQGARFVISVGSSNACRRGTIVLLRLPRNRASPQKEAVGSFTTDRTDAMRPQRR
jgi:hypothetical protein